MMRFIRNLFSPLKYKFINPIFFVMKNIDHVQFKLDGDKKIQLPKIKYIQMFSKSGRHLALNSMAFSNRPFAEPLLRKVVNDCFVSGYLDPNKSIIDIGCWIADNSLVWAKNLQQGAVYAIDPSISNLNFGSIVAKTNNIDNIEWIEAVCSDNPNLLVQLQDGDLSHGRFEEVSFAKTGSLHSSTIDLIIPSDSHDKISLFHVDVEGFEMKVLLGAVKVINSSKPLILFEQHISTEDPQEIFSFLRNLDYTIYMLNEVLPGCQLDCRNFIAVSSKRPLPESLKKASSDYSGGVIWKALLGPELIKIN